MNEELTTKELLHVKFTVVLDSFKVEYAGCGSHQLDLLCETNLEEVQNLYEQIRRIKGLKLDG